MSRHPEVRWAQRQDNVYVTILIPDAKDPEVKLEPEGVFTFTTKAGSDDKPYELKLELFDKVKVEESKINYGVRSIFVILEKAEPVWWNKLLRADGKAPHYIKVDWDKWVDEDEDTGAGVGDTDLGGMDFSSMGGMGGMGGMMGGMGGMPGMGGMGGMPGMGGMGGMPGMGGMGGMPGMEGLGGMAGLEGLMGGMGGMPGLGGMGGPEEFEDSDDEDEVAKPEAGEAGNVVAEKKAEEAKA